MLVPRLLIKSESKADSTSAFLKLACTDQRIHTPSHQSHPAISYSLSALPLFLQHCLSISFCLGSSIKLLLGTRRTREDTASASSAVVSAQYKQSHSGFSEPAGAVTDEHICSPNFSESILKYLENMQREEKSLDTNKQAELL